MFQSKNLQIESLQKEVRLCEAEIDKLRQENHVLVERNLKDGYRLTIYEQQLAQKEGEFEALMGEKDNVKIDYDFLVIKTHEYEQEMKIKLNKYEQEIERLKTEAKEYIAKLEEGKLYVNSVVIDKAKLEEIETLDCKQKSLNQELVASKQETSRFQIRHETLEKILERQKTENNRIFNELQDKLEDAQNQCNIYANEIEHLNEQIKVSKWEKGETVRDRDHLLNKVYEKDKSLKEVQLKLSAISAGKENAKVFNLFHTFSRIPWNQIGSDK